MNSLVQTDFSIDKNKVARDFGKAAKQYDTYAELQRNVADDLLSRISPNDSVCRILDLGSGTGYCTGKLRAMFPAAEIISLDLAEGMLSEARLLQKSHAYNEKYICADAEHLPFIKNSFDLVFSSLAIQWCSDYDLLFSELKRVLVPGGELFISTFGPGTLKELQAAWQKVDAYVHVNQFADASYLKSILLDEGFKNSEFQTISLLRNYSSLLEVARELKGLGASNKNSGQSKGLGGRRKFASLQSAFAENYKAGQGIPLTYQLAYMSAKA